MDEACGLVAGSGDLGMRWIFCLSILLGISVPADAGVDPVNETFWGGVAIHGYDPVAYFTEGKPIKGKKSLRWGFRGAEWRFSSEENLSAFRKSPEKYAPRYGGYCAWAVAQGDTADIDPEAWAIVDEKLYLNYNAEIQKKWESDRSALIEKADEEWRKMVEKDSGS